MKTEWETYWELQEAVNAAEDDGLAKRVSPAQPNIDPSVEVVLDASPDDGIDELEWAKKFVAAMRRICLGLKGAEPTDRERERLDQDMDRRIDAGAFDPEREVVDAE